MATSGSSGTGSGTVANSPPNSSPCRGVPNSSPCAEALPTSLLLRTLVGEDGRVSEAEGGAGTELWIGSSPSLEATASHSISTTPCTLVLLLDSMNQTFHHKEMTSSVVNKKYDLWFVGTLYTQSGVDLGNGFTLREMAKRAVKWPKHHSNTAALVALDMESARAQLLVMKLGFLRRRMMDDGVGVGAAMMSAMCDDVESCEGV